MELDPRVHQFVRLFAGWGMVVGLGHVDHERPVVAAFAFPFKARCYQHAGGAESDRVRHAGVFGALGDPGFLACADPTTPSAASAASAASLFIERLLQ
jgi:hypothetical protein